MADSITLTIFAAGAVGALGSAIVTASFSMFNAHAERTQRSADAKAERELRERILLLEKALDMAEKKRQMTLELAKTLDKSTIVYDDIFNADVYLQWLRAMLETGTLPAEIRQKHEKELAEARAEMDVNLSKMRTAQKRWVQAMYPDILDPEEEESGENFE